MVEPGITDSDLVEPVRRILHSNTATIEKWQRSELSYVAVNPVSGGVHRVAGIARDMGRPIPWCLVLKVIHLPSGGTILGPSEDLSSYNYWKREALAYQSGFLENLPGGLAAPQCYGISEQPDGSIWLWLEVITEAFDSRWPTGQYEQAARTLGAFNGVYLKDRSIPAYSWVSRHMLRGWVAALERIASSHLDFLQASETWQLPIMQETFAVPGAVPLTRLWAERKDILDALDELPQVLCHHDAYRANLIARESFGGRIETVAIDWSFLGVGPIGQDVAQLIAGSLEFFGIEAEQTRYLEKLCLDAYIGGLRAAGWTGDVLTVRFAYAATVALRSAFSFVYLLQRALRPSESALLARSRRRPIEVIMRQAATATAYGVQMADEAHQLLYLHMN